MPEEKRKINAWIPVSLYNKLETSGYENVTQALIKAIESFGKDTKEDTKEDTKGSNEDIEGYKQDIAGYQKDIEGYKKDLEKLNQDISGYKQDIKALNDEIAKLKEGIVKAPDLVEFVQLQARYEGLQEIIREKEEMIHILKQTNETLNTFAHYFKSMEVKQLQEFSTEESKPAARKREGSPQKGPIEKMCKYCNQPFLATNPKQEYCKPAHRTAFNREKGSSGIT